MAAEHHGHNYNCQPTKDTRCEDWILKTGESIGERSVHGKVYIACRDLNKEDCVYALKLVKGRNETGRVEHEVQMQNLCASKGFCMPVIDWWIHRNQNRSMNDFGIIITGLLRESVHNKLLRSMNDLDYSWKLIKSSLIFVYNFHQNGMYHQDTHLGNIMFTYDGTLKFIDLDTAETFSDLFTHKKHPKYFQEAINEDYSHFEENGLMRLVQEAGVDVNTPEFQLYGRVAHIIKWKIVNLITDMWPHEGENPFQYLDRLRDLEYENLNKILAMSIDNILNHEMMEEAPGAGPLPLTNQELITRPIPSITFLEEREEIPVEPPVEPAPVSIEVLGPPRSSIQELELDLPPKPEEPSIQIASDFQNILERMDEPGEDEPGVRTPGGLGSVLANINISYD